MKNSDKGLESSRDEESKEDKPKPAGNGKVPRSSSDNPPIQLKDPKVPDVHKYDGMSTLLRGFLDQLNIYFKMKLARYPASDYNGKIMYAQMCCIGAAMTLFTVMQEKTWLCY